MQTTLHHILIGRILLALFEVSPTATVFVKSEEFLCPEGEQIYEVSYLSEDMDIKYCEQTWNVNQNNAPVSIFLNTSQCTSPCTWSASGKIHLNQCLDVMLTIVCSTANIATEIRVYYHGKKLRSLGERKHIGVIVSFCLFLVLITGLLLLVWIHKLKILQRRV